MKSYTQIISSSSRFTCRPCYWRRYIRNLRLVYIHCVRLLRYRSCPSWSERLYHRPRKRAHVRSLAGPAVLSPSLFLSSWTDFNADEGRRCANVKEGCREGERECLKSRLMIRDDMRHSSLSDVWLDCRYCSLSFIFRELATDARVHASECA